jgi:hypothetical protein
MDMWAPSRIFDFRFSNFDLEGVMNEPQMKDRTKQFALRILKLADALPTSRSGNAIATNSFAAARQSPQIIVLCAARSRERISSTRQA